MMEKQEAKKLEKQKEELYKCWLIYLISEIVD